MKILVAQTRASDPDNADRVRLLAEGAGVDCSALEWKTNPFDEYALEAALRLTECGGSSKVRLGEIVVVSLGACDTESVLLRHALSLGADRAIRIDADEASLDGNLVAKSLHAIVLEEQPDLVIMGKLSVDTEGNQVGQRLAEQLGWPMASSVATMVEEAGGTLRVGREMDRGVQHVRVTLPAVVTVDLRVVAPTSVRSKHTAPMYEYPRGVRYAPLSAIIKAKKKPLRTILLSSLLGNVAPMTRCVRYSAPPGRARGRIVRDVDELARALIDEAKVF